MTPAEAWYRGPSDSPRVVAEEYLLGREFSVAVLGAREAGEEPIYQPPLEIEDKVQRTVEIRVSEATREILQAYRLGYLSAPEGQLFETP